MAKVTVVHEVNGRTRRQCMLIPALGLNLHPLFAMERVNVEPDQAHIHRAMHMDFRGAIDRMWKAE